jgi:hypothetical protein
VKTKFDRTSVPAFKNLAVAGGPENRHAHFRENTLIPMIGKLPIHVYDLDKDFPELACSAARGRRYLFIPCDRFGYPPLPPFSEEVARRVSWAPGKLESSRRV